MKQCLRCNQIKGVAEFYKRKSSPDGLTPRCIECCKLLNREQYEKHREQILKKRSKYRKEKPDAIVIWREKNPDKLARIQKKAYNKKRQTTKAIISDRIRRAVNYGVGKNKAGKSWMEWLDYGVEDLIDRLKETMPIGYTWRDFMDGKLEIDHIVPQSAFNFGHPNDIDFKRCWALSNLQLLLSSDNRHKTNKMKGHFQPSFAFYTGDKDVHIENSCNV